MSDPVVILSERLLEAMRAALGDALPPDADPLLAPSRNPEFGDFQANAAMGLAKRLGEKPRDLAQRIVDELKIDDIAEEPTIAGPGFINIRLKPGALSAALGAMSDTSLGVESIGGARTAVVDVCGVNLAKQMHVGHLRASVIGDALARIYERLGWKVFRQNHFGDWGLPIAMVTDAVKRGIERGEVDINNLSLNDLERMYRKAQSECAADTRGLEAVRKYGLGPKAEAELEAQVSGAQEQMERSKAALVALQRGDRAFVAVWEKLCEVTLGACFDICRRLHTRITDESTAGESTYRDELAGVVEDLLSRGVAEVSEGAVVVRLDEFGIKEPCLIRKRDGGFLYATTDMAAVRRRVQQLGGDRLIYAVDARQSLHFKQVFAAATKAGYARTKSGDNAELLHAAFGTVLGEDNRPFKTRSGDNVKLSDLLDEAVSRAEAAVAEKNPDLSAGERRTVAEAVGISAIKYADLSSDRIKDYVFSFDRMLAFEGNTGPYLLYALVRVKSILRKAQDELGICVSEAVGFSVNEPQEKT
ncbi:MAG: arginine--tRNA ligase, partial [Phycisphaerales bacterium]